MTFAPINSQTAFLPTSEMYSEDQEQLLIKLTQSYTNIAYGVNIREISIYETLPVITGQFFYDPNNAQRKRLSYRQVYPFGAIPAGGGLVFPHNIVGLVQVTHRECEVITSLPDFRPVPYVDPAALNVGIAIRNDMTNIFIAVGAGSPNVTSGIVILEYLLN